MEKKKVYLGTNTKMYLGVADTVAFLKELCSLTADLNRDELELFVIPSFTALEAARRCSSEALVRLGGQNMGWAAQGPYTGEISPKMLLEVGADIAELGHSERRHVLGETNEMVNRKVLCAAEHGLTVLLCVGETAAEKEMGLADSVLCTQLKAGLYGLDAEGAQRLWVAYEPVWAIGESGVPATAEYAGARHNLIRSTLVELYGETIGNAVPILYGGSVNRANAVGYIRINHTNGLFIGRSAWNAQNFNAIIRDVLAAKREAER